MDCEIGCNLLVVLRIRFMRDELCNEITRMRRKLRNLRPIRIRKLQPKVAADSEMNTEMQMLSLCDDEITGM